MTTPNDDQLRAMLEARAGRPDGAVPEEILGRVVRAARSARAGFALPKLLGAFAAGALVVVVAGVLLINQPGGPGATGSAGAGAGASPTLPSSEPSPAPSVEASSGPSVEPSAGPTATPSPTPTIASNRACLSTQLTAEILSWQGAAGNRVADIRVTNVGRLTCILAGRPRVQLRGANGAVLMESSATPNASPSGSGNGVVDVAPGGHAATQVDASNYCGPNPALPVTVALILPVGAGTVVAKPAPGTDESFAVPPCMGSAASLISMNGWTAAH